MDTVLVLMRFLSSIMVVIAGVICVDKGFDYRGNDLSAALVVLTGMAILGTGCWIAVGWLTP